MFTRTQVEAPEEPVRFESGEFDLYGMLHHPSTPSRGAVLFCTPDGEERAWTHRTYVAAARALAESGYTVLRFEYAGHGESSGAYEETSLETRLQNIASAMAFLRRRTSALSLSMVAMRAGAAFALEAAAADSRIDRLALVEPVVDMEAYVTHLLRVNLAAQMVIHKQVVRTSEQLLEDMAKGGRVSANGYQLTHPLVASVQRLTPAERLARFPGQMLIVATPPLRLPACEAEVVRVAMRPFWKEPKTDMTPPAAVVEAINGWFATTDARRGK